MTTVIGLAPWHQRGLHLSQSFRLCRRTLFTVLALESSADDTCAAVVTSSRQILSNIVVKQHDLHEGFGGIHPTVAIEAHQRNMPGAVRRALENAKLTMQDVDGIAFTRGPGIGGCLSVGSNAAKSLAAALNKPMVGVHHMQAHALTPLLTAPVDQIPEFPFLTLLISGGHTLLLLATSKTSFEILATTADESVGRSFDKVARMLALSWGTKGPGAALEDFCRKDIGDVPDVGSFPVPMPGKLAFSYSCLHSSIERYLASTQVPLTEGHRVALARAFQDAAAQQLCEKLTLGLEKLSLRNINPRHVVVSGGVASNLFLRTRLRAALDSYSPDAKIDLVFPPPELCTDNAVMIGWAAMHRFLAGDHDDYSIDLRAKWDISTIPDVNSRIPA
ncbi:glycoprotease family-domain-containing protein [Pisolithus orientalis]|uniref:glycoprotease family-domain-containing protein n=1 Tax=Pisolithus orientalis TaxID=936130 RepID=UPI002224C7C1|nr:glycoprotease family-domain-containing protein [Pisolithus orientalis]KAI6030639.1 glycoprotease family-domain-containing protein [Pisolithus orientalis]